MRKNITENLMKRLENYPGPHKNEKWKLDTDLTNCTLREIQEMHRLGTNPGQLMAAGLNRGQVAHILFGYKHTR